MDNDTLFTALSGLSGLGWIILIFTSPCWQNADKVVMGVVVLLLGCAYGTLNFAHIGEAGGFAAFLSYDGVRRVFANDALQLAAWAHILAVDLVAGVWMRHNARRHKIRHLVMIPVYLVTVMVAPLGVILFMIVRGLKAKTWFADNGGD